MLPFSSTFWQHSLYKVYTLQRWRAELYKHVECLVRSSFLSLWEVLGATVIQTFNNHHCQCSCLQQYCLKIWSWVTFLVIFNMFTFFWCQLFAFSLLHFHSANCEWKVWSSLQANKLYLPSLIYWVSCQELLSTLWNHYNSLNITMKFNELHWSYFRAYLTNNNVVFM